jgi:Aspartyl protease
MRHGRICILLIVAVLAKTASGATDPGNIPFKLVRGFAILVRGGVGPSDDLNFLVDTGAVPSVLGERIASPMGLTGNSGSLDVLHKQGRAPYVTVGEVRLGNIRATGMGMVVVDLAPLSKALHIRIDAILGLDLFAGQNLSIDYKHRKITPRSNGAARSSQVEIYTAAGAPYVVVPAIVDGHALRLLLDTGTDGLTLFAGRTHSKVLDLWRDLSTARNLMGEAQTRALDPLDLHIGWQFFHHVPAVEVREPPGALGHLDGIVGPTALGITRLGLDWERKSLAWDTD